ncbi:MAG: TIGR04086 family membrane protein [Clostridia bacterium]|nr:TIGR04086 family membrane protein [Clostridia bacterium]
MFQLDLKVILKYLRGVLLSAIVTLSCLAVCAFILSKVSVDRAFAAPLATLCLALGAMVGAFDIAYSRGKKGYLVGLVLGGCDFILITCAGMLIREGSFTRNTLFHSIIILLTAMIGGILGVGKKEKKSYI